MGYGLMEVLHLMPKYAFACVASVDPPHPDSRIDWARATDVGTPYKAVSRCANGAANDRYAAVFTACAAGSGPTNPNPMTTAATATTARARRPPGPLMKPLGQSQGPSAKKPNQPLIQVEGLPDRSTRR